MIIRPHILTAFFLYASALFYSTVASSDPNKEFAVKAAFIVKLTHFIQWPDTSALNADKSNFTICINQSTKFNTTLSDWAQSGVIKNKPVLVKHLKHNSPQLTNCDILFIPENEKLNFLLQKAKANHTLTISDIPGNAKRGVLINFINVNGKLRFEINLNAAEDLGFSINPRLLKLATIVSSEEMK